MLIATAVAEAGIEQMPVTGKLRAVLAESGGPPEGPGGLRVSATRQGASVKKLVPGGALVRVGVGVGVFVGVFVGELVGV